MRALERNQVALKVPLQLLMSTQTAMATDIAPHLRWLQLVDAAGMAVDPGAAELSTALHLMREKTRGPVSFWFPFMQVPWCHPKCTLSK